MFAAVMPRLTVSIPHSEFCSFGPQQLHVVHRYQFKFQFPIRNSVRSDEYPQRPLRTLSDRFQFPIRNSVRSDATCQTMKLDAQPKFQFPIRNSVRSDRPNPATERGL